MTQNLNHVKGLLQSFHGQEFMIRSWGKLMCFLLLGSCIPGAQPEARSAPGEYVVRGNTAFALELYGQLKDKPGNIFFSPYSISSCLAMTYAGARGNTEKQIRQVLHLDADQPKVHNGFSALQAQLSEAGKQNGIELSIAHGLWAQKEHPFLPAFLKTTRDKYLANIQTADFVTQAERVRGEINEWTKQKTKDRIQDILPPRSLSEQTTLVLVNAIYFKGLWVKQYDKDETSTQPFHLSTTRQNKVPLMHHLDTVAYTEEDGFQAVDLPYQGGTLSMLILLPRKVDGLEALEARLAPALISTAIAHMKRRNVEIFLPRFKLESSFELSQTLAKQGMPDAFQPKADFSGIDGTRELFISEVFHKAWGEVNEEGTEAAAATAVGISRGIAEKRPPPPPVFRADHPFIFFIRDTQTGSLLFMGRLSDPSP